MRKTFAFAFAALALTATPAMAEPVAFELRITHKDLDLSTEKDVETLRDRVRAEVRKACAYPTARADDATVDRACVAATTRAAFAKIEAKRDEDTQVASL